MFTLLSTFLCPRCTAGAFHLCGDDWTHRLPQPLQDDHVTKATATNRQLKNPLLHLDISTVLACFMLISMKGANLCAADACSTVNMHSLLYTRIKQRSTAVHGAYTNTLQVFNTHTLQSIHTTPVRHTPNTCRSSTPSSLNVSINE